MLERLDVLMAWCRMKFKPKKSRSLSVRKGKIDATTIFTVASQQIPTVSQEPVKSLGRWYDSSMKDTKRGLETVELATKGLLAIKRCGLQGKLKVWCLQFMLIPKLLWPLLVYEICSTTVEAIEAKINKFTRRWLGVPPGLTDVAMYCRKAKLRLPLKSILEEYKCGKARLLSMLEDSEDPIVKTVQPTIKTGRKWKVVEAVDEAKECLKIKEVIGVKLTAKGYDHLQQSGGQKQKGKRKETWSSMRYGSMKIPEGFRKQSSNLNRDNGLIGIMPCRNPSHGMRSGTWRHFGSAFSSDQCTISCPQTQIWYGGERKRTPLVRYAKAGRPQSIS